MMKLRLLLLTFLLSLIFCASAAAAISPVDVQPGARWTRAEMNEAVPLPLPAPGENASASPASIEYEIEEEMGPVRGEDAVDPTAFPNRTMGVLFGEIEGEGIIEGNLRYRCSATSVVSPHGNLVLTAGHCIDNIKFGKTGINVVFVPGYRQNSKPYGQWPVTSFVTTPQWEQTFAGENPDFANDLAFLTVAPQSQNGVTRQLGDAVGELPLAFNTPRDQDYEQYGYSVEYPYNGSKLYRLKTHYVGDDQDGVPYSIGVSSDFTPGCSGGAWLANGAVVGVNSHFYPEDPRYHEQLYSPYFGNNAQNLYAAAGGPVPTLPPDKLPSPPVTTSPSGSGNQSTSGGNGKLRVASIKLDVKRGSAEIGVRVPDAGQVVVSGHGIRKYKNTISHAGIVYLIIYLNPRKKPAAVLAERGFVRVLAKISYRSSEEHLFLKRWVGLHIH